MTMQEFLIHLPNGARTPSDEEYDKIHFVAHCHPSISINDAERIVQMVMLYSTFGMRIILDMMETAKRAREIGNEILELKCRIADLEAEQQELSGI